MALYILQNGRQTGPYSDAEIAVRVESGVVAVTDLVWEEGMEDWLPLEKVRGVEKTLVDGDEVKEPAQSPPPLPIVAAAKRDGESQASTPDGLDSVMRRLRALPSTGGAFHHNPPVTAIPPSASVNALPRPWATRWALILFAIGTLACVLLFKVVTPTGISVLDHPPASMVEMRGEVSVMSSEDGGPTPLANVEIKLFKADRLDEFLETKVREFSTVETPQAELVYLAFKGAVSGKQITDNLIDTAANNVRYGLAKSGGEQSVAQMAISALTGVFAEAGRMEYGTNALRLLKEMWGSFILTNLPNPDATVTTDTNGGVLFKGVSGQRMVALVEQVMISDMPRAPTFRWFVDFDVNTEKPLTLTSQNEWFKDRDEGVVFQSLQKALLCTDGGETFATLEDIPLEDAAKKSLERKNYDLAISQYAGVISVTTNKIGASRLLTLCGEIYKEKGDTANAIKQFREAIQMYSGHGRPHFRLGCLLNDIENDREGAMLELSEAIRLNPNWSEPYFSRAFLFIEKGAVDDAIADYTKASELAPQSWQIYVGRAFAYKVKHNFRLVFEDLAMAAKLAPTEWEVVNEIAWFLSTCPETEFRNGKEAVAFAKKACELKEWKDWSSLDTLAAAFAEAGMFDEAQKFQEQALSMPDIAVSDRKEMQERLQLWQQHKPYRE
jgi:tetratricopeptide (TPR) repeat protein